MDHPFENEFYGYEPQRPMTEKIEIPATVEPALDMNVFENEAPPTDEAPQSKPEPPVQGYYAPPAQAYPVSPVPPVQPPVPPAQPPAPPVQPPVPPVQPPVPPVQPPAPPVQPSEQPFTPPMAPLNSAYDASQQPFEPQAFASTAPEKPRQNHAMLVVIIVLSALLGASLFGLVGFSVYHSRTASADENGTRQEELIPDFTFPDDRGGFFDDEEDDVVTTAPEHKESDYSDQIDKNYPGLALADKPADAKTNASYSTESAFQAVSPSVVSVLCFTGDVKDNSRAASQGSGIVISEDGLIVTNAHLVGDSKTAYAIKVVTADDKEYTAGVVGVDGRTDLAVLKLKDAKGLKPAVFGNSDQIELGEDLIIIGNPGGIEYKNSMTKGIVSAINRDVSSKSMVKYIQTDAAINPGNSGGPAVNKYGQVIGVASAKIANQLYEGMGFCIPSAQVKQIADSLIRNGYVEGRVRIGIVGTAVTASEAEMYNLPSGIQISSVTKGGPCDGTELRRNDIITAVDGKPVTSFSDVYRILEEHQAGDKIKLTFYRDAEEKQKEIEITLQADNP